jgi:hypothetical protein
MQTYTIGVGMVGESRELYSKKSGEIWRYIVKIKTLGFALEIALDPKQKELFDALSKLSGEWIAFRCSMGTGLGNSIEFKLDEYKPGTDAMSVMPSKPAKGAA